MRFRKLRIAWSGLCGFACVLLIVLWVRSYKVNDFYEWSWHERDYRVTSNSGEVSFQRMLIFSVPFGAHGGSLPARPRNWFGAAPKYGALGLSFSVYDRGWYAAAHYGLLTVLGILTAAAPWIGEKWRFSLRTLVIVFTLLAVVLGLATYASRK